MKPRQHIQLVWPMIALMMVELGTVACTLMGQSQAEPSTACNLPTVPHTGFVSPLTLGFDIPSDVDIIQNEGQVCVQSTNLDTTATHLEFTVSSSGCYSSSCSLAYERNGKMYIDRTEKTIQFFSRFMVKAYSNGDCGCTADCGGAGAIVYAVNDLPLGIYQLKLGTKTIGEIPVPFRTVPLSLCFSTETAN
jgi:hypothetical protein